MNFTYLACLVVIFSLVSMVCFGSYFLYLLFEFVQSYLTISVKEGIVVKS